MAAAEEAVEVGCLRLSLDPENTETTTAGRLAWRGGCALSATAEGFGGFSGLLLTADGSGLTAVSDEGRSLTATLAYGSDGELAGLTAARLGPLHDTAGRLLSVSIKRRQDAEALARLSDGSLIVAFEREHRLQRFPAGLDGPTEIFAAPPGIAEAADNAGIEALVTLADGCLLAFGEEQRDDGSTGVWLRQASGGWQDLSLRPGGPFRPTGAALLPDGDVLLLERRYTLLGGLGARVSRIAAGDIRPGVRLEAETLGEFAPPLTVDNFEGIAAHRTDDGSTRITLLSDDNFSIFQRTLIVQFELLED